MLYSTRIEEDEKYGGMERTDNISNLNTIPYLFLNCLLMYIVGMYERAIKLIHE